TLKASWFDEPKSVVSLPSLSKLVSRLPSGLYRVRAKWKVTPILEYPAATILPSAWIAILLAPSSDDAPMGVVTMPVPPKVVSSSPLGFVRSSSDSSRSRGPRDFERTESFDMAQESCVTLVRNQSSE